MSWQRARESRERVDRFEVSTMAPGRSTVSTLAVQRRSSGRTADISSAGELVSVMLYSWRFVICCVAVAVLLVHCHTVQTAMLCPLRFSGTVISFAALCIFDVVLVQTGHEVTRRFTFTFTYPLTAGVVGAPQMTSQPIFSLAVDRTLKSQS